MITNTPDGMMPASEFGQIKGISDEKVINMIRDGFYAGQIVDGQWYIRREELQKSPALPSLSMVSKILSLVKEKLSPNIRTIQFVNAPALSITFYVLAVLGFIGGIILSAVFWPGDPGYGNKWEFLAYTPSITWFMVGVIEAAIFAAIGQGLSYLHRIVENTSK